MALFNLLGAEILACVITDSAGVWPNIHTYLTSQFPRTTDPKGILRKYGPLFIFFVFFPLKYFLKHKKWVPVTSNKRSCTAVPQECEDQFHCIWIQESVDILLIQQINKYHEDLSNPGWRVIIKPEHPLTGISVSSFLGTWTWEPGLEGGGRWDQSLLSDSWCCPGHSGKVSSLQKWR